MQILPPQSFAEIPAGSLDLGQELAEFDRAVTLVAAADDVAGGDIQTVRIPTPASPQIYFVRSLHKSLAQDTRLPQPICSQQRDSRPDQRPQPER
jgi:hypothetical protein